MRRLSTAFISTACISALLFGLSGCNGNDRSHEYSGPLNAQGYPAVAGSYSLTLDGIPLACTSSSTATLDTFSETLTLRQNGSQLVSSSDPVASGGANFTFLSNSGASGSVDNDGNLFLSGAIVERNISTNDRLSLSLAFTGFFSSTSMQGDVAYTGSLSDPSGALVGTCSGVSTFSGSKL